MSAREVAVYHGFSSSQEYRCDYESYFPRTSPWDYKNYLKYCEIINTPLVKALK